MEIHPCVLQYIGPLRPLPSSRSTFLADHSKQGIGYRWPCAILGLISFVFFNLIWISFFFFLDAPGYATNFNFINESLSSDNTNSILHVEKVYYTSLDGIRNVKSEARWTDSLKTSTIRKRCALTVNFALNVCDIQRNWQTAWITKLSKGPLIICMSTICFSGTQQSSKCDFYKVLCILIPKDGRANQPTERPFHWDART